MNKTFEDLVKLKSLTKKDLDSIPRESRPGWSVKIDNAVLEYPKAYKEYANKVFPEYLAGATLKGNPEKIAKIHEIVLANGGIVVDIGYYAKFTQELIHTFSTDWTWRTGQHQLLNAILKKECEKLEVEFTPVDYKERFCKNADGVTAFIKSLVEGHFGNKLITANIKNTIVDAILKDNLAETKIPVVFVDATQNNVVYCHPLVQSMSDVDVDSLPDISEKTVGLIFKFKKSAVSQRR